MTIETEAVRAAQLVGAALENNPVILWRNLSGALSSPDGFESDGALANALDPITGSYALPSVVSGAAQMTWGTATLNSVAIAAHNLGTLGATVAIEFSDDGGSNWTSVASVSPNSDDAVLFRFEEQVHDDWRLSITSISSGQPSIGVLTAGLELVVERPLYQGYAPPLTPTNITLQANVSEGGNYLGAAVVRRGSSAKATLDRLSEAFLRSDAWAEFQAHFNDGNPFFWAWGPAKYGDCHYAWRSGGPAVPSNTGPLDLMSVGLSMQLFEG